MGKFTHCRQAVRRDRVRGHNDKGNRTELRRQRNGEAIF